MQQYEVQFIESEEEAKVISDQIFNKIAEMGVKDEKSQKEAINQIFNKLFDNLNLAASTPASKFMTTLILRDIIQSGLQPETKLSKLFTVLLSHKLFKHLQFICDTIDPFKIVNEKGKAQFSSDPISGNNLIRCALEIVKFLAYKFPKSKNEEPTAFKRSYNKLIEKKVVFPSDYKYITIALVVPKGGSKDQNGVSSRDKRVSAEMAPPKQKPQNNRENEFNFLCNRLKTFMQTLEEEDEEEQLLKEINKMHGIIKIELPKINNMAAQVTDTADAEFVNRFFDVVGLMEVQQDLYERFIDHNRDLRNYVQQLKRAGQKVFPSSTNSKVTPGRNDNGKNDQKDKSSFRKVDSIYVQPPPEQRMKKIQATEPKEMASANELKQISKYFLKIEERSKSPINGGFKKIGQSLSRQKSKNSTIRSKVSPLNKSNFNKSINSLKQSKVAAIFTNPPNVNPPSRHYEGHEIPENEAINSLLARIDKNQGHRRFKTANFKGKSSLFQNQHLQIGYKSEAIYEQISGFRVLLKIQLFFGNLGDSNIRNLSSEFKGDQNILLYANPRSLDTTIVKGQQNKIQLIIIPLKPQFPLLTAQVRYEVEAGMQQFQIIVPNSALKFAHFMEVPRDEFLSRWSSAQLYKTTEFQLSHYLPPDTLVRWIPSLSELVSYTTFVVPSSKKDYELFTSVLMMQKFEALLKINVRPNMNVVIQLGVQVKIDESNNYFTTFLQHLQQFMKQNK